MSNSKESWTTIESDPGVFTELLQRMGVQSVQVEELYALDEAHLRRLKPVYGLIFLFKWRAEKDDRPIEYAALEKVWFANQVIQNACATQAILSILFNRPDVELGPDLAELKSFTASFPPQLKGMTIGSSKVVRDAHNSFRPPEAYIADEETAEKKDSSEVYHFIGYVPVQGVLYELDGLKEGPIRLCDCQEVQKPQQRVSPFIRGKIEQYAKNEIRFNLMAVIKNRSEVLQCIISETEHKKEQLLADLETLPQEQKSQTAPSIAQCEDLILRSREDLASEEVKIKKWKEENVRRKHNYIPFLFNFLKLLAEKDQLRELIDMAKDKQQGREETESNTEMQE